MCVVEIELIFVVSYCVIVFELGSCIFIISVMCSYLDNFLIVLVKFVECDMIEDEMCKLVVS